MYRLLTRVAVRSGKTERWEAMNPGASLLWGVCYFYKIARILLDALTTTNVATCDRIFP